MTDTPNKIKEIRAALEAHQHGCESLQDMAEDMARIVLEQAEEIERLKSELSYMRSGVNDEAQACEQLGARTGIKSFSPQAARLRSLAAYRKAVEGGE